MKFELPVPEISVHDLKQRLDARDSSLLVLDVREPHELAIARLPDDAGVLNVPIGTLVQNLELLKEQQQRDIAVLCRSGHRSEMVTNFLLKQGFPKVRNVKGGILAWSESIDPAVPAY